MASTRRSYLLHVVSVALLGACGSATDQPDPVPVDPGTGGVPTLTRVTVATGLSSPWDVALTANGTMFYTERCAGLSVRFADGSAARLFGSSGSSLVAADLSCEGQSGMNGVALDPAFASNRRIYVYMGSTINTPRTNRVIRLVLGADLKQPSSAVEADSPEPNSTRPLETRSNVAIRSAVRAGWL